MQTDWKQLHDGWKIAHDPQNIGIRQNWASQLPEEAVQARVPGWVHLSLPDAFGIAWYQMDFEDDRILEVIRRKYKCCFEDEKNRQRAVNGLLRLGYSYSDIKDAFAKLQDNEEFSFFEVQDE